MKYTGKPFTMWTLFGGSFRNELCQTFYYSKRKAKGVAKQAKVHYKEIIHRLPEFDKEDPFQVNIISCAMFIAFLLAMENKPNVDGAMQWYQNAMMTKPMIRHLKKAMKKRFSREDIEENKRIASRRFADGNVYSWNMELYMFKRNMGYEIRFTKCGICVLLKEYGLMKYAMALCQFDYAMAEAGGNIRFERNYTIASGGPFCDCRYIRKEMPRNK